MCQITNHPEIGNGNLGAVVLDLVPKHPACEDALVMAQAALPASILYHSFRVYLYANHIAYNTNTLVGTESALPPHVLFVACILHDFGTSLEHDNSPERFEVSGANAAASVLKKHGIPELALRDAALAIALHTSSGIAEWVGGIVTVVRLAVLADFGKYPLTLDTLPTDFFKKELPRLEVEKELGDAVVRQAIATRGKAPPASWPGVLLRAKEEHPEWKGVNKAF